MLQSVLDDLVIPVVTVAISKCALILQRTHLNRRNRRATAVSADIVTKVTQPGHDFM